MTNRKALELGNDKQLIVDPELDFENDLELFLDTDCGYGGHYVFLKLDELRELRDHIDALLAEHDKTVVLSQQEVAAFAKRWDARVTGHIE